MARRFALRDGEVGGQCPAAEHLSIEICIRLNSLQHRCILRTGRVLRYAGARTVHVLAQLVLQALGRTVDTILIAFVKSSRRKGRIGAFVPCTREYAREAAAWPRLGILRALSKCAPADRVKAIHGCVNTPTTCVRLRITCTHLLTLRYEALRNLRKLPVLHFASTAAYLPTYQMKNVSLAYGFATRPYALLSRRGFVPVTHHSLQEGVATPSQLSSILNMRGSYHMAWKREKIYRDVLKGSMSELPSPAFEHVAGFMCIRAFSIQSNQRVLQFPGDYADQPGHRESISMPDAPARQSAVDGSMESGTTAPARDAARSSETTITWVAHVLAPHSLEKMDRRGLTNAFRSMTRMLAIAFHPSSPAHQESALHRHASKLKSTLDPRLPFAMSALIVRTAEMAAARGAPQDRLGPAIALKLVADMFHVAPRPLLQSVIQEHEAIVAISTLLRTCSSSKRILGNAKYAGMVFSSLISFQSCSGALRRLASKSCYEALGRIRANEVMNYDYAAVEGLCWMISKFRSSPDQTVPRAWWSAMRRLEALSMESTVPFKNAAHIAESIANVQKSCTEAVQSALLSSARHALAVSPREYLLPSAVTKFLNAAARLEFKLDVSDTKVLPVSC